MEHKAEFDYLIFTSGLTNAYFPLAFEDKQSSLYV